MTEKETKQSISVAIHQPNFLPRLKVLQKLAHADIWCVLDTVQYCSREWANRARIVAMHGNNNSFWLSIPVHLPSSRSTLISEVKIVAPTLIGPLIEKTLFHAFHLAPCWNTITDLLSVLEPHYAINNLTSLCIKTTCALLQIAKRQPTVILASSLPVKGKSSNLIALLCKYIKANIYLTGSGSYNYLDSSYFTDIEVLWQNWHEPRDLCSGIDSWRNISSINYLARFGKEKFVRHLLGGEFTSDHSWQSQKSASGDKSSL